jgi:hypothetical protein
MMMLCFGKQKIKISVPAMAQQAEDEARPHTGMNKCGTLHPE